MAWEDNTLELVDFVLHIDSHLAEIVQDYGQWTYLLIFLIIFSETGFVVTPFLPGDSLLFVIGSLAANGVFSLELVCITLLVAAVGGNTLNYYIGRYIGRKAFDIKNSRFIKQEHLLRTEAFYQRYGGITIVISRFMPIIRTFAPFVAGIGRMSFSRFMSFNLLGGMLWVLLLVYGGYFFGNIPLVKNNFGLVMIIIIGVSLIPALMGLLRHGARDRLRQADRKKVAAEAQR